LQPLQYLGPIFELVERARGFVFLMRGIPLDLAGPRYPKRVKSFPTIGIEAEDKTAALARAPIDLDIVLLSPIDDLPCRRNLIFSKFA
jgi:hypothetical protein